MNNLIIISAPSGSGKTTICKYLQKLDSSINFSVSCTTRQKRENEVEGKDYFFTTNTKFEEKIKDGKFVEWEQIHGDFYYGTLKSTLDEIINKDKTILLELDVKGAMSVKKLYPKKSLSIFIEPPSVEDLKLRLQKRGADDNERIVKRLGRLDSELAYKSNFDYHVINDDLDQAVKEIMNIINNKNKGVLYGS
jgi:guanylate kinase|tara:strand:- start:2030 stop:2608 length:579 start_codon:yes stop_codon:yes gene_type:complete